MGKKTILILTSLLFFQLIYGFLFPSVGSDDSWQPIAAYLPKFQAETTDSFILDKIYPFISLKYRLNSDVGNYLELAQNFHSEYFKEHVFLNRPLYPFLIWLASLPVRFLTIPSYGLIFGAAILLNFVLIGAAVLLFFHLLQKLFSLKIAWLSSILLIFSPFVHSYLNQPLAEMLMAFAVVFSAYLLDNYIRKPSTFKLIVFSLLIGTFMLGKMFFAISFFILLLAFYFRRYKEGIIFLAVHSIPLLLWYTFVTQIWQIGYFAGEVENWHMGVWLFDVINWPWQETFRVFLGFLPNFITAFAYSFLLIPVIFSVIGFQRLPFRAKNIFYFGPIFSVFLLGILISFYYIRHAFLLFPIIYPAAVLGMERTAESLRKYRGFLSPLFYVIIISLIILISNINIYRVFDYNG